MSFESKLAMAGDESWPDATTNTQDCPSGLATYHLDFAQMTSMWRQVDSSHASEAEVGLAHSRRSAPALTPYMLMMQVV